MSLRDKILKSNDKRSDPLEVAEWGVTLFVRSMSARERQDFANNKTPDKDTHARLAVICCVDEAGEQLFTDKDVDALSDKSAIALDKIARAALRINGIGDDAVNELKKT